MTELTEQCQAEPSVVSIHCLFVNLYQLVRLTGTAIWEWETKKGEWNYSLYTEILRHRASSFPKSWGIWHLTLWHWRNTSRQKEKRNYQNEKLCSCCFSTAPFSVIMNSNLSRLYIKTIVVLSAHCPRLWAAPHLISSFQDTVILTSLKSGIMHVLLYYCLSCILSLIHSWRLWTLRRWTTSFMNAMLWQPPTYNRFSISICLLIVGMLCPYSLWVHSQWP